MYKFGDILFIKSKNYLKVSFVKKIDDVYSEILNSETFYKEVCKISDLTNELPKTKFIKLEKYYDGFDSTLRCFYYKVENNYIVIEENHYFECIDKWGFIVKNNSTIHTDDENIYVEVPYDY